MAAIAPGGNGNTRGRISCRIASRASGSFPTRTGKRWRIASAVYRSKSKEVAFHTAPTPSPPSSATTCTTMHVMNCGGRSCDHEWRSTGGPMHRALTRSIRLIVQPPATEPGRSA